MHTILYENGLPENSSYRVIVEESDMDTDIELQGDTEEEKETDSEPLEDTTVETPPEPQPIAHLKLQSPNEIFSVNHNGITKTFLMNTFAPPTGKGKKEGYFHQSTQVKLDEAVLKEANSCILKAPNYKEVKDTVTTMGRVVVYHFLADIEYDGINLATFLPFKNEPITKKVLSKQDNTVVTLLIEEKIPVEIIEEYTNRLQWLGYTSAIFTLPSLDLATITPSSTIRKYRDQKLKENKEALDRGDLKTMDAIEKDVLKFANKQLDAEGATGKLIYDSGFNGDFNNNYKNTAIFRGLAPKSDNLSEFFVVTSSLSDGVKKEDIVAQADVGVSGASGRAKDTQLAGYKTKIFNAAFGSVVADKHGTDCKTKRTRLIKLSDKNYDYYKYRFIETPNGLEMLNDDTKDKFIGKTVKMRTPLYCISESICHKCLGDYHYKVKVRNIGLMVSRITTNLMGKSMKAFHNMSVDPKSYNLIDYIEPL